MNFIEELYYGNINPNEKRYKKATPYDKALSIFTANEDKLKEALSGEHLKLFNELVNASDEISATSGVEREVLRNEKVINNFNNNINIGKCSYSKCCSCSKRISTL